MNEYKLQANDCSEQPKRHWEVRWFSRQDYAEDWLNGLEEMHREVRVRWLNAEGERILLVVNYVW